MIERSIRLTTVDTFLLWKDLTHILLQIIWICSGASGPGGAEFAEFKSKTEADHQVGFYKSLADVPSVADGVKRLALISGRTMDNPRLLGEAIAAGCSVIYLEKPGAPSVKELEVMKKEAADANVQICMGYNKVRHKKSLKSFKTNHQVQLTNTLYFPRTCANMFVMLVSSLLPLRGRT